MRRAAIVSPVRTPIGRFLGSLAPLPAERLGEAVIRALVDRSGVDPERIDDVVFAQGYPSGEAPAIGRWAALAAGLPEHVPGMQLDRRCGGGLQAVASAAAMVQSGMADVVIAGGAESMSNVEHYTTALRQGRAMGDGVLHDRLARGRVRSQPEERHGTISGMIETAENLASDYGIGREECDAYAARSQQRAEAAWAAGAFDAELVPLEVPQKRGEPLRFDKDEGVRPGTTMESLAKLRPMMADGVCTAGNSSQQNDAAAACLVVAEDRLAELGLDPVAWFTGFAAHGCDPSRMGIGPVGAVAKLFARTGLGWDDIGLVELNEAFAAQVIAVVREWGFDWQGNFGERLNPLGSGISLGHPIGATGGRILATMLHEMPRRGARYALETMCIAGGQGAAAIFEAA